MTKEHDVYFCGSNFFEKIRSVKPNNLRRSVNLDKLRGSAIPNKIGGPMQA